MEYVSVSPLLTVTHTMLISDVQTVTMNDYRDFTLLSKGKICQICQ